MSVSCVYMFVLRVFCFIVVYLCLWVCMYMSLWECVFVYVCFTFSSDIVFIEDRFCRINEDIKLFFVDFFL
jgi:hypothetical protein